MSKRKQVPHFENESDERNYWEQTDSTEHMDWSHAKRVMLPNIKPSTKTISLRLPESLLHSIKVEANKRDMPYQSLIKSWLASDVKSISESGKTSN